MEKLSKEINMNINPMDLLKNLKDMQSKMSGIQEKLKDLTVKGSAGGDMVVIEMNCEFKVLDVKISPEAVDTEDIEMLEDLVQAAFTSAISNAKAKLKEQTNSLAGGLNIPSDLFNL